MISDKRLEKIREHTKLQDTTRNEFVHPVVYINPDTVYELLDEIKKLNDKIDSCKLFREDNLKLQDFVRKIATRMNYEEVSRSPGGLANMDMRSTDDAVKAQKLLEEAG